MSFWFDCLGERSPDVSATCAVVIIRVKVSCITPRWWHYTLVIDLIGQVRRDVIGRLSVKP